MGQPITLNVAILSAAPVVDGRLGEWSGLAEKSLRAEVQPALEKDPNNQTGFPDVAIYAGVHGDRFYLAARWPDTAADTNHRPWRWRGGSYQQDKKIFDDGFAIRFHMDGDYDTCMLSNKDYRVDLWRWSAGRTDLSGLAEDRYQVFTLNPTEGAAEHPSSYGTVYILNRSDAGDPIYTNRKAPKEQQGEVEPSITLTGKGSGSIVDVTAKGEWKDGYWNLEMSRLLRTGHDDDAELGHGKTVSAAVAVFNHAANEHKSVSNTINMVFPP
ncbi:MAG: EB dh protein [Magnetococcales bacterium]|nr:EB dh protein [Magnetococcales bacterium]